MTNKILNSIPCLMALAMSMVTPFAATAAPLPDLRPEAPLTDAGLPSPEPTTISKPIMPAPINAATTTTTLNGSVEKEGTEVTPLAIALAKLSKRIPLTAEDYRSLGIGILGFESTRTFFQNEAKMTKIYPGCPAAQAGIKTGDRQVVANVDDSEVVDPTRPVWMFSCGIAGEPYDMTIKRQGELLNFHLVRMNMEDVPDAKLRHTYEKLVQKLGAAPGSMEMPEPPLPAIVRALGKL